MAFYAAGARSVTSAPTCPTTAITTPCHAQRPAQPLGPFFALSFHGAVPCPAVLCRAVSRVMDYLSEGKTAQQAAEQLVKDAIQLGLDSPQGEADNTSALVLLL